MKNKIKTSILFVIIILSGLSYRCEKGVESTEKIVTLIDLIGNWYMTEYYRVEPEDLEDGIDSISYSPEIDTDFYNAFFMTIDEDSIKFNMMLTGNLSSGSMSITDNGNGTFTVITTDSTSISTSTIKATWIDEDVQFYWFGGETTNTEIIPFEQTMLLKQYNNSLPFELWEAGIPPDKYEQDNSVNFANNIETDQEVLGHSIHDNDVDYFKVSIDSTSEYIVSIQNECFLPMTLQILDSTENIIESFSSEDTELLDSLGSPYNSATKFIAPYTGNFYIMVTDQLHQQGQYILNIVSID